MIKSTEMKKNKEDLVEKLSSEMSRRLFKLLEKTVDGGFLEFCENGKIAIDKETTEASEKVEKEIMDREKLSLTNNPKFWDEICNLAENKTKEFLEVTGWELDDDAKYLVPLEAAQQSE